MTTDQVELSDHAEPSTDQVRQGETGHGVRYMLAVGTGLAVLAIALAVIVAL
jgi:hypothetical protein